MGRRIRLVESVDGGDRPYGNGRVHEDVQGIGERVAEKVYGLEDSAVGSGRRKLVTQRRDVEDFVVDGPAMVQVVVFGVVRRQVLAVQGIGCPELYSLVRVEVDYVGRGRVKVGLSREPVGQYEHVLDQLRNVVLRNDAVLAAGRERE